VSVKLGNEEWPNSHSGDWETRLSGKFDYLIRHHKHNVVHPVIYTVAARK